MIMNEQMTEKEFLADRRKWVGLYLVFVAFAVIGTILLSGCNETQQVPTNIKPLAQHLLPTPQDWKDA